MTVTPVTNTPRVSFVPAAAPATPPTPAAPAAASTRTPAADVAMRFGKAFEALGATVVTAPHAGTLIVRMPDAATAGIAAGVLRERVDGVHVLVQHPGGNARPAGSDVDLAKAAARLPQFFNYSYYKDVDGNGEVTLWAPSPQMKDMASRLVRSRFDGSPVRVVVNGDFGW